jgi:hypothetical protein
MQPNTFTVSATLDEIKLVARWGTRGKSGKEPVRWVRLVDCSTEHLQNILKTQPQLEDLVGFKEIIESILQDRQNAVDPFKL